MPTMQQVSKSTSHSTRSQNYNVNSGPTMGGAGPKDTKGGKDTGGDATNVIIKCGVSPKEYSPSSTSQSRNR